MEIFTSPYVYPLLLSALVALGVAGFLWNRRLAPGAISLAMVSLSIFFWALGYAMEIASPALEDKIFWSKVQYIGIPFVGYFWLLFALAYTSQRQSPLLRWLAGASPLGVITLLLAWTNEYHQLIWVHPNLEDHGAFSIMGMQGHGLWFSVHFVFSYLFLISGVAIVVYSTRRMQGLYRFQIVTLVIAAISPLAANIIHFIFNINPDPTPYAFTITVCALAWSIFGYHLGDISPVARDQIIEAMREGMVVLDAHKHVVDINSAAGRMIGLQADQAIGKQAAEVFSPWPHLSILIDEKIDTSAEFSVGEGAAQRRYEIQISVLFNRQKAQVGQVITIRESDLSMPKPRFAVREPVTKPLDMATEMPKVTLKKPGFWQKIVNFFIVPIKTDIQVKSGGNIGWTQTLERAFTSILRIAAGFGTITLLATIPYFQPRTTSANSYVNLVFVAIIGIIWFLGLVRNLNFATRAGAFLFLIYAMSWVESTNFGYTVEGFTFFLTFVTMSALLFDLRGGFISITLSAATLSIIGFLVLNDINIGTYQFANFINPKSLPNALASLLTFLAASASITTAITILLRGLNRAWRLESQALNLLQQERDLLEQRVVERTQALSQARDQAIKTSVELRKYFLAIEQSGNSIVITDERGQIEYVNPHFEQVTGYTAQETLDKNMNILKSGVQGSDFYRNLWQTIAAGQTWQGEFLNRRKDGSLFWESAVIAPLIEDSGKITHYVAIKEDITHRKELQASLTRQNQYLSVLHQTTLDLLNRKSLDELLQTMVTRASQLFDAPLSEVMLKEGDFMVVRAASPSLPYTIGEKMDRTQAGLTWKAHDTAQPIVLGDYATWSGRNPLYQPVGLHAAANFPIMVGQECIGVLALGRSQENQPFNADQIETGALFARLAALVLDNARLYDSALKEIAERERTEKRIQEFLDDMKSMQEIHLALSQLDDLDLLYVQMVEISQNRLGLDRMGLFVISEDGTQLQGTYGIRPDGHLRDESYFKETITETHWTHEIANAPKHTVLWDYAPLYDDSGIVGYGWKVASALWNGQKAVGYIVCDTLTTRRPPRVYEAELVSLLGSTFGHLIERKRSMEQLAIARDQALEASRFKSQLLAKVSHELRTPLGGVIGYAELVQQEAFGPLTEEQNDAMKNIVSSANYLNTMINELLDEAQIEARAVKLHFTHFSPAEMLGKVESNMSILAHHKGLTLQTEIEPGFPEMLNGDERRLQQIMINLTGNAIKFTTAGYIRIKMQMYDENHWAVSVQDTGAGIPKDAQKMIFDPFRQVDNAITRNNRGTGLGLSITRQLAELMGGRIELESEVGQGSTFTVILPVHLETEQHA